MLANGWAGVTKELALPYRDIALALGVGWLAYLVVADAVISPSGCGNIYMNATPRVIYGWAQTGTFFKSSPASTRSPASRVRHCG
jgi:amino acid transporter